MAIPASSRRRDCSARARATAWRSGTGAIAVPGHRVAPRGDLSVESGAAHSILLRKGRARSGLGRRSTALPPSAPTTENRLELLRGEKHGGSSVARAELVGGADTAGVAPTDSGAGRVRRPAVVDRGVAAIVDVRLHRRTEAQPAYRHRSTHRHRLLRAASLAGHARPRCADWMWCPCSARLRPIAASVPPALTALRALGVAVEGWRWECASQAERDATTPSAWGPGPLPRQHASARTGSTRRRAARRYGAINPSRSASFT